VKGVDDDRDARQPGGQPPHEPGFGRVGVNHVRAQAADQAVERPQRGQVAQGVQLAAQRRDEHRRHAQRLGVVGHVAFVRADVAADQHALELRRAEPGGEQRDVDRRAADVQPGDDAQDADGALRFGHGLCRSRAKDAG